MKPAFQTLIKHLAGFARTPALSGIDVDAQFSPDADESPVIARTLNAGFLIVLSGPTHPQYERVRYFLENLSGDPIWGATARFYLESVEIISHELSVVGRWDGDFQASLKAAAGWCERNRTLSREGLNRLWKVFFPEGSRCLGEPEKRVEALRAGRTVHITKPNSEPIRRPARDILFMSNLLVTIPPDPDRIDPHGCSAGIREQVRRAAETVQKYWYDHPIQIGVRPENNEAIYGLRGLNEAMRIEKGRGVAGPDDKLTSILSVSVTHEGLQEVATTYLREVYAEIEPLRHLEVFIFSEADTRRMIEEILTPGAERFLSVSDADVLEEIFGVDGEYGRHYNFLKAFSVLWQVLMDPEVKASFKIDMDQIFDQDALIRETGRSALEHFATPLWGATGHDASGRPVDLGLMAGALVNGEDIENGLFTPDVTLPEGMPQGESLIFHSRLPQAVSTQAEMMTRYHTPPLDGVKGCIHRIHVTGGTCAALVRSLRTYRPFTPSFIGRAEDQAFLLSALFSESRPGLRYLHKPGLIMRHDKESFAAEAVKGAKSGKYVGDLVRTLLFSAYGRALPWSFREIKDVIDPFTGCFVSHIPMTVVTLRLAFHLTGLWQKGGASKSKEASQIQQLGVERLQPLMKAMDQNPDFLEERVLRERRGWDHFYDLMDRLETALSAGDAFALKLKRRAETLIRDCAVRVGQGE